MILNGRHVTLQELSESVARTKRAEFYQSHIKRPTSCLGECLKPEIRAQYVKSASMFGKPFLSGLGNVLRKAGPAAQSLLKVREERGLGPAMTGPGVGKAYRDLVGKKGYRLTPEQRRVVAGHLREMVNYRGGNMADDDVRRNAGRALINLQTSMREMHNNPGEHVILDTHNIRAEVPRHRRVQTTTNNWLERRYVDSLNTGRISSQDAVFGIKPAPKGPVLGAGLASLGSTNLLRAVKGGYPLGADGKVIGASYGTPAHNMKGVGNIKNPTNTTYYGMDMPFMANFLPNAQLAPASNRTMLYSFNPRHIKAEKRLKSSLPVESMMGGFVQEAHGAQPFGAKPTGIYKQLEEDLFAKFQPAGFSADGVVNKALRGAGLSSLVKTPTPTPVKRRESFQPIYEEARQHGLLPQHWNRMREDPQALPIFKAVRDAPLAEQTKQLIPFASAGSRQNINLSDMARLVAQTEGRKAPNLHDYVAAGRLRSQQQQALTRALQHPVVPDPNDPFGGMLGGGIPRTAPYSPVELGELLAQFVKFPNGKKRRG